MGTTAWVYSSGMGSRSGPHNAASLRKIAKTLATAMTQLENAARVLEESGIKTIEVYRSVGVTGGSKRGAALVVSLFAKDAIYKAKRAAADAELRKREEE